MFPMRTAPSSLKPKPFDVLAFWSNLIGGPGHAVAGQAAALIAQSCPEHRCGRFGGHDGAAVQEAAEATHSWLVPHMTGADSAQRA